MKRGNTFGINSEKPIFCYYKQMRTLLSNIPIKKMVKRMNTITIGKIERMRILVQGLYVSDKRFLNAFLSTCSSTDKLLNRFSEREKPIFFVNKDRRGEIVRIMKELDFNSIKNTIKEADRFCEHIFDLLGSGPVELIAHSSPFIDQKKESLAMSYQPIDWHIDFKSGTKWRDQTYYREIKIQRGADRKVPRELSRFHHLVTLGESYWYTGCEKYAKEFVGQIIDWVESNQPEFGINWQITMDVAIRACNWIVGYCFFKNSREITNAFLLKFLKSLYQHGRHIMANLERSKTLTTNHYLSDIVGLVYLGVMFPRSKEVKKWREFGTKELKKEMEKQVYPDGVDFEASTCYHRLVLELFFYATFLVIINHENFKKDNFMEIGNEIFGEKYLQHLYKMFEFVLYALKPNGRMPQIGDNDNGRLHIFSDRGVLDMRYLLTLGAIFFTEPKFKIKEFGFCEEALWVFGEKGYEIWQDLEENRLANVGSRAFPNAGWYIMRNDQDYMIISCGPNGQNGNGGHCHNDKLSFELCVNGEDVIVDPGTYVYTADPRWRNKFRSISYHNTVVVDEEEQNRFDEKSIFEMKNDAETKCLKWKTSDEIDIFIGEHYGYKRFSQPLIHKREIKFHKKEGKLEIIDKFRGEGIHNLKWNLILSPEFRRNPNIGSDKLQWHREPAFYSSEYGIITKAEKLTSTLKATIPVEVKFWIEIKGK